MKVNEVGEKGNEREGAVRYEELGRIEEESDGKECERRREKNIKFKSSTETHGLGLVTIFCCINYELLPVKFCAFCNKFSQARPTQPVNETTDISLLGDFVFLFLK